MCSRRLRYNDASRDGYGPSRLVSACFAPGRPITGRYRLSNRRRSANISSATSAIASGLPKSSGNVASNTGPHTRQSTWRAPQAHRPPERSANHSQVSSPAANTPGTLPNMRSSTVDPVRPVPPTYRMGTAAVIARRQAPPRPAWGLPTGSSQGRPGRQRPVPTGRGHPMWCPAGHFPWPHRR